MKLQFPWWYYALLMAVAITIIAVTDRLGFPQLFVLASTLSGGLAVAAAARAFINRRT